MTTPTEVFLLNHVREGDVDEPKLLGVYSSRRRAEDAIARYLDLPGFRDEQEGFVVDRYTVDEDHWREGFVTV
jgi:hypothetical protein